MSGKMEDRYKITITCPYGIEISDYMDIGEPAPECVKLFVKMMEALTFNNDTIYGAMQRVLEDEGIIDKKEDGHGKE